MKKIILPFILLLSITTSALAQKKPVINIDQAFDVAAKQYTNMLASHPDITKFPQSTKKDGTPDNRNSAWWCSGFFGGSLWYLFEYTGDTKWKTAADKWTKAVEKEKYNTSTHDLGFMLYCPFGNGYRLTKNEAYIEPILTGAKSLATRFDPKYGLIKSWDKHADCEYPVIIDNMMNLEFLFWAAKQSKDKRLYDIAVTHADNTLMHHFRPDFSSYHVVCYLPGTKVFRKKTHQGAADSSAWARGQAWALYGYTMMFRETKNQKYLQQAEGIAKFIINHPNLPEDKIPYWDFNAPNLPNEERDASAGAIFASALLELSTYSKKNKAVYFNTAEKMLLSLASPAYTAKISENNNFILKHSVGHKPGNSEINTPIVYADYYYLEALLRYQKSFGK
ncbi:glycoside hydrolase family 88 protein [Pedobacter insulae]|uniref:Glycosyl Hydrolase Family 88 n=1 Tax=Pedobacter insulae TaxID=414048 RepID=A0A1I2UZC2_9SPHI|nr:glycoside hydrolase family 88 protein [Pedobacter insulae]SFG82494.1 Glycosyl Hydrolase Family 88 [Pedobacter insulae]